MSYTNSKLVSYTKISPNRNINRNHKIDTVSIHCVVGQCSVETLGSIFASMLMVNKEAQQNRTRTVSPAAIPSKANYRVKSKKHL